MLFFFFFCHTLITGRLSSLICSLSLSLCLSSTYLLTNVVFDISSCILFHICLYYAHALMGDSLYYLKIVNLFSHAFLLIISSRLILLEVLLYGAQQLLSQHLLPPTGARKVRGKYRETRPVPALCGRLRKIIKNSPLLQRIVHCKYTIIYVMYFCIQHRLSMTPSVCLSL